VGNVLAYAGKSGRRSSQPSSTVFAQEDARDRAPSLAPGRRPAAPEAPKNAALMDEAGADVVALMSLPKDHRPKLHTTDEIDNGRNSAQMECVVWVFPKR
jgi:hypothetical protein